MPTWPHHKTQPLWVKEVQIVPNSHTLVGFAFGFLHLATMATLHLRFLYQIFFLSLCWQDTQIAIWENELVFSSALKWKVAIFAKLRSPKAKPDKVWPLCTIWTPLTPNGLTVWFGQGWHCTTLKKLSVKAKLFLVSIFIWYYISTFCFRNNAFLHQKIQAKNPVLYVPNCNLYITYWTCYFSAAENLLSEFPLLPKI